MKICSKCKTEKAISEFEKDSSKKDGHKYQCKTCRNAYRKSYEKGHPVRAQYVRNRIVDRRATVRRMKEESPCTDCGIHYPYYVMQYDHIGTDKLFNISSAMGRSMASILAEIAKCELVCANCHATRTHKRLTQP